MAPPPPPPPPAPPAHSVDLPRSLLCPYEAEDPAFRSSGRLPNLRYGDQVRAIWVTRFEFHSHDDIVRIVRRSAQAGFNTAFFQVRGNATTYYSSKLEPWSEAYNWRSPGFDPLQLAVSEAHSHNMSLHAWVNVMPMWRGSHPPSNSEHIFNRKPEWSWYNRYGERQPLNRGFYVSINPCLPDSRQHIVEVCREIVSRYEVDGLHLDYIRFPNEPPVVDGKDYSLDKRTLELFHADTGSTPDNDPRLWDQWRCDCVTALLRDIRRTVKSLRPQLVLTAAVGAERKQAMSKFQDVDQWWKERLLDAVVPMNYTGCQKTFRNRVEREWLEKAASKGGTVQSSKNVHRETRKANKSLWHGHVQEVGADTLVEWSRPPEPAIIMGTSLEFGDNFLHQKQLALALQRFGHFSIFCYSSLFGVGNGYISRKYGLLFPFLKILADASQIFSPPKGVLKRHPFRAKESLVHPEEAFPYDQLHFYDQVPIDKAFRPSKETKFKLRKWGERGGGRRIVTDSGDVVKLDRRTFRKNLRMQQWKKDTLLDEYMKRRRLLGQQDDGKASVKTLEELSEHIPMKNWEAFKMLEATAEEEANLKGEKSATCSNRMLNSRSGLHFPRQKNTAVFQCVLQVTGPHLRGQFTQPFCCISLSQKFSVYKIEWDVTLDIEIISEKTRRNLRKWLGV